MVTKQQHEHQVGGAEITWLDWGAEEKGGWEKRGEVGDYEVGNEGEVKGKFYRRALSVSKGNKNNNLENIIH